jgi:hypothetical protein
MKSIVIDGIEYKFVFEPPHGSSHIDVVGDIWRDRYKDFYMQEAMKLLTTEQKDFLKKAATELINKDKEKKITEKQATLVYPRPSFG